MLRISRSFIPRLPKATAFRAYSSRPVQAVAVAQKSYWQTPAGKAVAWTTLGACLTTASYLTLKQPAYAESPTYAGTVEEPTTNLVFPIFLNTDKDWKRLIGLGPRTVTFLNLNVYVLGLYMRSEDIGELKNLDGFKDFDKSQFLKDDTLAEQLIEQPYDVSIRLVPARTTNSQHLRDGFLRLLLQRMKDQHMTEEEEREVLKGIQEFKSKFVSMKVKKDTEFIFTKTKEGDFKMSYEGKDLGTVHNSWIAKNFLMGYLNPKSPSSEAALLDIVDGFERILKTEEQK